MQRKNAIKSITLAVIALALSAMPAAALEKTDYHFRTTKNLYNLCSVTIEKHGAEDYATASYACRGFIGGAVQYHDGVSGLYNLKRLICYPDGTTLEDGRMAFVTWAEANLNDDALMNETAVKGLVRALSAKYPCGK